MALGARVVAGLGLLAGYAGVAHAAGPELDAEAKGNSPLLLLAPESANLSAPAWVKPGTRISFYGMSGSVPEGGYSLDKDPNGTWQDPATGERYSKNEAIGAGGEGFMQVDVVSVGQHAVALNTNLYTIIQPGNPPTLLHTPLGGMVAAAAGPADLWVHPDLLKKTETFHTPNFFILRGPYPIQNKTYQCLCIVNRSAESYSSQAYDLETGVLVSGTVTSAGKAAAIRLPNEDAQRGNKGITITKFIGVRQLQTPGINGTNPAWVAQARAMHFVGRTDYVNTIDPSIRMAFPTRMDVTFGKRGENWCWYEAKTTSQMPNAPASSSQSKGLCGPAGLFWIDPAALKNLKAGQVLDDDPVTHIRTAVISIQQGGIYIGVQGPGVAGQAGYDLNTGMLRAIQASQPSSGFTTTLELQGTE